MKTPDALAIRRFRSSMHNTRVPVFRIPRPGQITFRRCVWMGYESPRRVDRCWTFWNEAGFVRGVTKIPGARPLTHCGR